MYLSFSIYQQAVLSSTKDEDDEQEAGPGASQHIYYIFYAKKEDAVKK